MRNRANTTTGSGKWIGILAYGSLIQDPGPEIEPLIVERIPTQTPFPVEFARLSKKRGDGPTVAPHFSGSPVKAEILVLDSATKLAEAQDLLWRREVGEVGSGKHYPAGTSINSVIVAQISDYEGVACVLYTDFHAAGKNAPRDPVALASCAIHSVPRVSRGKDGISYLMQLSESGVVTPLTDKYTAAILRETGTPSLRDALTFLQSRKL